MHPLAETPVPNKILSLSRILYLIGSVLALILIVPTAWFPLQLGKLSLFATFLALSGICFVLGGGMRFLRGKGLYLALFTGILPIVSILSWYFSIDRSVGLVGLGGLEASTLFFSVLGFLSLLVAFALFRTKKSLSLLFITLFVSLIVAAIFQVIAITFGTAAIPFQTFADRSVNLIGKWNDLGLLLGILVLWALMKLEWSALSNVKRWLLVALMVAVGILLGLIHFPVIWSLLCAFSVLFIVVQYVRPTEKRSVPWYAISVAVISILFLVFGTSFNANLTKLFPVSSLEVRPSYLSTLSIISAAHPSFERTLLGSGPDTFRQEWIVNRPQAVNLSAFWNLDFNVGYSTLLTAFSDTGFLGAIAWLIPLALSLFGLLALFRSHRHSDQEKMLGATIAIAAIYLWVASGFYVLSQNLILLAFVLTGALLGIAYAGTLSETPTLSRIKTIGMWVCLFALLVGVIGLACIADRLFLSESYTAKGSADLSAGDTPHALTAATQALRYQKTPDALGLAAQVGFSQLQTLAAASSTEDTDAQTQFVNLAQQSIAQTKEAILLSPQDYRSYVLLGQIYAYLASLSVQGAYGLAQDAYTTAAQKNPTDPEIPLLQATLEAGQNNLQGTQQFLEQSLTLKQNFTNAILLVVQLDVSQKDLPHAISAAQAAVQSAPSVASIWFELGVLYYTAGDTANAIAPLQQAIQLQSDYANAQYFLGLSYYAQGSTTEAIQEFTQLQETNPDSQEVALILSNMQAGKDPFTAAKPPISTPPENRATAPISE